MSDVRSEFLFERKEIARFDASLAALDATLETLARRYRLRLLRTSAKGWPGRTLHARRWLKTYSLRASLNPAYVDTNVVRWDVDDVWMYDYGELGRKTISFRQLAADIDVATPAGAQTVAHLIESALRENFPSR